MKHEREFGPLLKQHRERVGLSQHALAKRCGMHFTAISQLERGVHEPRLSMLVRLACGLGITAAELVATPGD